MQGNYLEFCEKTRREDLRSDEEIGRRAWGKTAGDTPMPIKKRGRGRGDPVLHWKGTVYLRKTLR